MNCGTHLCFSYRLPKGKIPWKVEKTSLSAKAAQRLKWMDYIYQGHTVTQCSRHFDIPEPTVRYWKNRYDNHRLSTLEDQSKLPRRVRRSLVPIEIRNRIIDLRTGELRGCGKRKVQVRLKREGIAIGRSTIQRVINESGLKRIPTKRKRYTRKNRKHMYSVPREMLKIPGGLVYMDVKHLILPGGCRVYQFTALDHATRLLGVKVYSKITSRCGVDFLNYLQGRYPFQHIRYIGTDNGSEFLGDMEEELKKKEIEHVFSSPRSPKQNPYVERVIRTIIDEVYYYEGVEISMVKQQEALEEYVYRYNNKRPHMSLGYRTPMEEYDKLVGRHTQAQVIS